MKRTATVRRLSGVANMKQALYIAIAMCLAGVFSQALASGTPKYRVQTFGNLGGTSSLGASINDLGWIAGRSNFPGNQTRHATLWKGGQTIDLGTLGGPNSVAIWPVKNVRGVISGITQTAEPDPYNEPWSCSFFFPTATNQGYRCVGFRWQNGVMKALPTLGGTHGYAAGTNNFLRTVGWAENTTVDPTCTAPQKLQFRAVVWDANGRVERELAPVAAHSTSAATALNDLGQIVGISGECDQAVGRRSAISMVLWEGNRKTLIPSFGGTAWNTPTAISPLGTVVGFANASAANGTDFVPRAFMWSRRDGTRALARLDDDTVSQATGVNLWNQAVGQSCDAAGTCRAVLWQRGQVYDLNDLIGTSTLYMYAANDIDNLGRITGQAYDTVANVYVAFRADPVH